MYRPSLKENAKPSAKVLKMLKKTLEQNENRAFSDEEVYEVAEFMYKFSRMAIELVSDERDWKNKLKEFPNGYEFKEKGYQCRLCGGGGEEGMWYDKYGLKCLHCQKAVESGLIPGELTGDAESFYSELDLEYYFNVNSKHRTVWMNKGIIKARDISFYNDISKRYKRLFLMSDNVGFLPPKEMLRFSDTVIEEREGEMIEHHLRWYQCCDPFEYLKEFRIMKYLRPKKVNEESNKTKKTENSQPAEKLCAPVAFPLNFQHMPYPTKKRKAKRKKT